MKWAEKVSVSLRVMLILILLLVALSGAGMALLIHTYVNQVDEGLERICRESADTYIRGIEARLQSYALAMEMIQLNQTIRTAIFRSGVTRFDMVTLSADLDKQIEGMTYSLYQNDAIYSHYLYTRLPGDGGYFRDLARCAGQPWHEGALLHNRAILYEKSKVTGSYLLTIALAIPAPGDGGSGAPCFQTLTVDTRQLFRQNDMQYANLSAGLFVFDGQTGRMVLSTSPDDESVAAACYQAYMADPSIPPSCGTRQAIPIFHRFGSIDTTALLLFFPSRLQGIGVNAEMLANFVAVALIFAALLILFLFYWVFTRRMELLIGKMDRFDEREGQPTRPMGGRDEIARMDKHLVEMQGRILYLIQEEYISKIQNMNAQHEALIACINPHFLYNSLNTVSAMAGMEGAEDTVKMVEALSDMFRYSSAVMEKTVPLERELQNISDYLYIQKIRRQNGFSCEVQIPEEFKKCLVPKLLLQPLVENAFKHGFTGKHGFTSPSCPERLLRIRAWGEEECLSIEIWDNGCGIPAARLDALRESLDGPDDTGRQSIGLKNVHRRIRLLYGGACGLDLNSEEDRFTSVTVRTVLRGEAIADG